MSARLRRLVFFRHVLELDPHLGEFPPTVGPAAPEEGQVHLQKGLVEVFQTEWMVFVHLLQVLEVPGAMVDPFVGQKQIPMGPANERPVDVGGARPLGVQEAAQRLSGVEVGAQIAPAHASRAILGAWETIVRPFVLSLSKHGNQRNSPRSWPFDRLRANGWILQIPDEEGEFHRQESRDLAAAMVAAFPACHGAQRLLDTALFVDRGVETG